MQKEAWQPSWIRGGAVEDMVFIGKDVIAWCTGVHILFCNVAQHKETIRWCYTTGTGDGARCLSAHSALSIFCFSESGHQPKILVYSYPSMTLISECLSGERNRYLATAFTARDHIVSVGWYPYFLMTVWCWRTGDKIITVNTFIHDKVGQMLRITEVGANVVAQLGRTCGKLYTWELDVVGKTATLQEHEVKLPDGDPIQWVEWCPTSTEPLLALTDRNGHIFLSNYDGTDVQRIVLSQRCGVCIDFEWPIIQWFREGILLRTTFCQIRYYVKNLKTNRWQTAWYLKLETRPCIIVTHPLNNDWCFYHTFEGYLMQLEFSKDSDTPVVNNYLQHGAEFKFIDFIYPWCHHVVGTDNMKELIVLEAYSGTPISTADPEIQSKITCQASHPDCPMIVIGSQQGELVFISFADPEEPKTVAFLRLQDKPLDLIKFSYSGRSLIAADTTNGNSYCISLRPDKAYTVQALLQPHRRITDVLIYEGTRRLMVLVLFVGAKQYSVGQQLMLFVVPEDRNLMSEYTEILEMPGVYRTLWQHPSNAMMLIGTPYLTKQLRVQRIQDFRNISLADGIMTGHHVRMANLFVDRQWLTTTAFDGLVHVRDRTLRRIIACFVSHHRSDFGCVKAIANRAGDLVVAMGYNGSVVATRKENASARPVDEQTLYAVDYTLREKNQKKILSDYASLAPDLQELLSRPKFRFPDPETDGDKTWIEWREKNQLQREAMESEEARTEILKDFEVLKKKVKTLLDANEACSDIEKLPVSAFDLDRAGRDHKLKAGRNKCEDIRLEFEHTILEMNRVSVWMRETFWNPQKIVGKSLVAIFGDKVVTNYPSVAEDPRTKDLLQWANFSKECVSNIMEPTTFQPWRLYTEEELDLELNKRMRLYQEEDIHIEILLDEEEDKEITEEELAKQRALEGTIVHRFIEPSPCYSQMESYGFGHAMLNNRFLLHDCEKIRSYFNAEFEEVYALKEREMNVIRDRIARICYINSELETMFKQRVPYIPKNPTWHWQESPEGIVKVFDHEVKAKPYVSPSQQEILDKQAAEAERIRLLLLADDFRERALMTMMDGVLEVRWEDIIKIDVPKPACMLEKQPENYTEEDILSVKKYEKDVQFLQEERERYKRMLDAEYTKVMALLREGIDKFNGKLDDLFHLKINIESAINQMHLRYVRGCLRNYHRTKSLRREEEIKEEIVRKQHYEAVLQENVQTFENVHQEMVLQHEATTIREKAMSRRFRHDFTSLNKFHVELLERQFKRRPKTNLKNLCSFELADLANHVVTKTRSAYMTQACRDYMKALDHLDVRPHFFPPTLDSSHWDHLTRLRRQKIESELKSRAKEAEIVDANNVIEGIKLRLDKCRSDIEEARERLGEVRRQRTNDELDVEMQFVLKMGQVEVNLTGDLEDTQNGVLVSREEILLVNAFIESAGKCKLDALSRLLNFKSGILMKEWTHECQRKRLTDLQEDLHFLEMVTVTKELQQYLKRKARGLPDDKTFDRMSVDVDRAKAKCERIIEIHKTRLASIHKDIAATRSKNEELDRRIVQLNVERCDMELRRDRIGETRQRQHTERTIRMVMRRSNLIKKLQDNYAALLELQTEYELLRLRRYPTLHFKFLNDDNDDKETGFKSETNLCPC